MKTFLAVSVAAAALATTAFAADLPARSTPPAPAPYVAVPVFTWTGFYVGGNAGYGFSDQRAAILTAPGSATLANNIVSGGRARFEPSDHEGFTGGGQVGYNYQIGSVVVGVEADAAYTDLESRRSFGTGSGANFVRHDLEYLGTVRGRVGYAFDRVMVYGTGGFAYGDVTSGANFYNNGLGGNLAYSGFRTRTETGWTAGGGVEYAIPTSFNLFGSSAVTLKTEALYYDLGRRNVFVGSTTPVVTQPGYNLNFETSGVLARAGVNFKFNAF